MDVVVWCNNGRQGATMMKRGSTRSDEDEERVGEVF